MPHLWRRMRRRRRRRRTTTSTSKCVAMAHIESPYLCLTSCTSRTCSLLLAAHHGRRRRERPAAAGMLVDHQHSDDREKTALAGPGGAAAALVGRILRPRGSVSRARKRRFLLPLGRCWFSAVYGGLEVIYDFWPPYERNLPPTAGRSGS
ncbi:hypothetical protein F4778DRAFT_237979 [Xylariomycetidae sp. FL2044]|nr:hypothetical protein F4778DRAFT_237979 [Xylariomycetidae sp. FL2044]